MKPVFSTRCCIAGALCALLLGSGSSAAAAGAKPLTAIFLVARDGLSDPYFGHSVVLVMNNLGPGPVGIIINRPTSVRVSHLFPDLKRLAHVRDTVYFGGPVGIGSVWFLFRARGSFPHAVEVLHGVYLSADPKLLLRLLERHRPMQGLRIYAGHAGWAPGQLQSEIKRGFWTLRRADASAIFSGKAEYPWPAPRTPHPGTRPASSQHLTKTAVSRGARVLQACGALKRNTQAANASRYCPRSRRVGSSVSRPSASNFSCARKTSSSGCGIAKQLVNSNAWRS